GPIAFPVNFLNVYKAGFAAYCEKNGVVGTRHVNTNLSILFTAMQTYDDKRKRGGEVSEVPSGAGVGGSFVQRSVNMPMIVSCGPKPSREIARPGGVKQETPDFKVKSIALNYGGAAPTKVNPT